jgi:PST family polysaccharide transporter
MNQLKQVYHDGWHIFISTLAINLYTASNIVILGFLTNHTVVGYYSGASKIIGCIKSLLGPVSQAIYPYISQMMKESTQQGMHFLKKLLLLFGCAGTIMSLMIFAGSKFIVLLFLGDQYEPSVLMLQLMSLVPMMVALSNILGIQTMLPLGMEKIFSRILISSAVLNTIIIFPLTISYGGVGTSLTMSITESFVTVTMAVVLWRKYSQGKLFDEK